ncbi:MAG: DUF721 domain-containing protein [Mycobacteriales bacterium]
MPERSGRTDLARSALEAARAGARGRAAKTRRVAGRAARPATTGGYTGARADPNDPALVGDLVRRLVADRGWQRTAASASVVSRWDQIVGSDIAAHAQPRSLIDGELIVVAESTTWATQLRLLSTQLLARITTDVGSGVVTRIRVHGPTAPSWRHGPRRVAGRGPRDTYG